MKKWPKISNNIKDLNNIIKKFDLTDKYNKTLQSTTANIHALQMHTEHLPTYHTLGSKNKTAQSKE